VLKLVGCLEKTGDIGTAIHLLESLTQQESGNYEAWLALGRYRQQLRLMSPALDAYQHAARLNPQSLQAWSAIAVIASRIPTALDAAAEARAHVEWLGGEVAK
jgi:cytochrome c-type biogenesis protein CcmH/NrfG